MPNNGLFGDDRKLAIVVSGGAAAWVLVETVRTGNYLDEGWPHPFLIAGLLSGIFCAGLVFRRSWSRWVGLLLIAGLLALATWHVYLHGPSLTRLCAIVAAPFLARFLWTLPITRVEELLGDPEYLAEVRQLAAKRMRARGQRNQFKIAVLCRDPVTLDARRLAGIAERAFGQSFAVIDREIDPVDAVFLPGEQNGPVVGGVSPTLLCYCPPQLMGVHVVGSKYPGIPKNAAEDPVADSIQSFIEVVILPHLESGDPVQDGYGWTGKLAAELMDEGCVAVYFAEKKKCMPASPGLRDALRNPGPASVIDL